jgi:hypothetical protein
VTIREATAEDEAAVEQLFRKQPTAFCGSTDQLRHPRVPGARHLLVLDAPRGGLAAAALVTIDGRRGHLALLAVDHEFEGAHLEDRMIGVAEALCRAYDADTLDVPVRRSA